MADGRTTPPVDGRPGDAVPAEKPDLRLLELLVCPLTKTSLVYDEPHAELISRAARLAFPIREGIPVLSLEAARPLADEELRGR